MAATTKQRRAVEALANGATVEAAAAAAGVTARTVRRWRNMPAFVARLNAATAAVEAELSASLRGIRAELVRKTAAAVAGDAVRVSNVREALAVCQQFGTARTLSEPAVLALLDAVLRFVPPADFPAAVAAIRKLTSGEPETK